MYNNEVKRSFKPIVEDTLVNVLWGGARMETRQKDALSVLCTGDALAHMQGIAFARLRARCRH